MSRTKLLVFVSVLIVLAVVVIFQILNNQDHYFPGYDDILQDPYLLHGQELSLIYCGSCHVYPDPSLLPKTTWRFETLPAIAPFLGVDPFSGEGIQDTRRTNPYVPDHIYPS